MNNDQEQITPDANDDQITVRMPAALKQRVTRLAVKDGRTAGQWIRVHVQRIVEREEKQAASNGQVKGED